MLKRQSFLGLVGSLAMMSCTQGIRSRTPEAPEDFRPIVKQEVAATIHAYMAGFSAAKCEDVRTVSKFVRDDMIYVAKSDVFTIPLADYEQGLRDRVCTWVSHSGVVDSVTVDALSRDVAVAAWLYHDEVKLISGEIQRYRGSTLMTLVRTADGWKISSTMSTQD
jgi:ketosteroid isomerase-like protein